MQQGYIHIDLPDCGWRAKARFVVPLPVCVERRHTLTLIRTLRAVLPDGHDALIRYLTGRYTSPLYPILPQDTSSFLNEKHGRTSDF